MSITQVSIPDIGTDSAKVIDILVAEGDTIAVEDSLITIESDKASMDVPSSHAGVITSIKVSVDQDVSEGTVIVELEASEGQEPSAEKEPSAKEEPSAG